MTSGRWAHASPTCAARDPHQVPFPQGPVRDPVPMSLTDPVPETQTYACPRCSAEVTEVWYGPCHHCREVLRASLGGESRPIEPAAYVPKMNVTPNAVATKD